MRLVALLMGILGLYMWADDGAGQEADVPGRDLQKAARASASSAVPVQEGFVAVEALGGLRVRFKGSIDAASPGTAPPGSKNVLLLHGAKFTADTWANLGTLDLLAGKGYRVAAIDLPGHGKTQASRDPSLQMGSGENRAVALQLLAEALGMGPANPPVIVSPSMSGSYSLPLLLSQPSRFAGYVPVAPPAALEHAEADFERVKGVPALVVYGENDRMGARASALLARIPGSEVLKVPGGSHPCYLDAPDLFHDVLARFLAEDAAFAAAAAAAAP